MFITRGLGNHLLKEAVIKDFKTLSVESGEVTVMVRVFDSANLLWVS